MIDRAVVLAAGRGSRLGELTANKPKPLLEVGGRTALDRVIAGLRESEIHRLALVTGHLAQLVEDAVWGTTGMSLEIIRQEGRRGTGEAIKLAKQFAGGHPLVFAWSDVLVDPVNYQAVVAATEGVDAVIAVNPVDDPASGAAVYVDDDFIVTEVIEKPPSGESATSWNNAGFGVLGPRIWPHLEALEPSERGEYELTDALVALLAAGGKVRAVPIVGEWFDIGTLASLAAARGYYAQEQP